MPVNSTINSMRAETVSAFFSAVYPGLITVPGTY